MKTNQLMPAEKLEYVKRSFPHLYRFMSSLEHHEWVRAVAFINDIDLISDFYKLDKLNRLLGSKFRKAFLVMMQSELIGMSLEELVTLASRQDFLRLFSRYHVKYPRVIKLWLDIYRHDPLGAQTFEKRRAFFYQMIDDVDRDLACKFLNFVLRDPTIAKIFSDRDYKVLDSIYIIYCKDRALYRKLLQLPLCKSEDEKIQLFSNIEMFEGKEPTINTEQFTAFTTSIVALPLKHAKTNLAIGENSTLTRRDALITELEDYIHLMNFIPMSKRLSDRFIPKEIMLDKKANKHNVKVTAAQKLLRQAKGENVGYTAAERAAMMTGELMQIQSRHLTEIELLQKYIVVREHQPEKFFSGIYDQATKIEAARKRVQELKGLVVKYTLFEKLALKQGRLGEIEKIYRPKPKIK